MREDINADYKAHNNTWEILKLTCHYISKILLWSIFLILIIVAVTLIVYFVDLRRNIKNGKDPIPLFNAYVIISPSMVPAIKVQDAVVVMRVPVDKLKKNDIITFDSKDPRYDGITITHRIVGIENKGTKNVLFRTKGDNNNAEDTALVKGENIYGKVILRLPKIGYIQYFLSNKFGWIIAIVIPCLAIIIYDIIKLIKTIRNESSNIKNNKKGNNSSIPKTVSSTDVSTKKKKSSDDDVELIDVKKESKESKQDKKPNKKTRAESDVSDDEVEEIEVLRPDTKSKPKESKQEVKRRSQKSDDEYLEMLRKYSSNDKNNYNKKRRKGGR